MKNCISAWLRCIFFDEVVGKDEIFWFAKLCYKDIVSYHSVPKKVENSSIVIDDYILIPHYSLVINKLTSAFFI